jgi:hypothetical protein
MSGFSGSFCARLGVRMNPRRPTIATPSPWRRWGIRAVEEVYIAVTPNGVLTYFVGARHFHRPLPSKQLPLYGFALARKYSHGRLSRPEGLIEAEKGLRGSGWG